jgi:subfamily B ATP-binding cassette protein MsbA
MDPTSAIAKQPPNRKKTVVRLFGRMLPNLHVALAAIAATGIYAGMMTARVAVAYPVMRVMARYASPEELQRAGPGGELVRSLTKGDSDHSKFLARVNARLDRIDAAIGRAVGPILPRKLVERKDRFAQVCSLGTALLCFLAVILVAAVAHFFQNYMRATLVVRILTRLRVDLLGNLLNQPLAFYNDRQRGELISRMNSDVTHATSCLMTLFGDLLEQPFMIVSAVLMIALINPWLLALVILFVPFFVLSLRKQSRKVRRSAIVRQETTARVTEAMVQMFSGIQVVKAFGLEQQKVAEYSQKNLEFAKDTLAAERSKAWTRTRMELLTHGVMVLGVLGGMLLLAFAGDPPGGLILLFLVMMAQMHRPLKVLTHAYTEFHDTLPGAERVFEFMDLEPGLTDKPGAVELGDVVGSIRYEDVSFAYNGSGNVLEHVNLEVPAGQVVALVGPSGAGKSTLVSLVPRFYDPGSGRVTLDGTDIREFTRQSLLRHISLVTQDPFLFNTTIAENIGYGRPGATMPEIIAAAQAANIHDFILTLPRGYDTVVGERGALLSGGQCQRLTVARAILKDAKILILDEATSSLDTENERAVQAALQNLMKGRTTLVIAHRLSTITHADKIVVLQDGRVAEMGSHDELLSRPESLYRRLYEMQFATVG